MILGDREQSGVIALKHAQDNMQAGTYKELEHLAIYAEKSGYSVYCHDRIGLVRVLYLETLAELPALLENCDLIL